MIPVGRRPAQTTDDGRRRRLVVVVALAVVLVLVVLATLGTDLLGAAGAGSSPSGPGAETPRAAGNDANASAPTGAGTPSPSQATGASGSPSASAPISAAGPTPSPSAGASAGRSPTSSPMPASAITPYGAPTSARGFKPTSTVVPMILPFRAGTRFTFGDGFRRPRDGVVYPYNLIRGVAPDGTLLRAHDGQDLLVPLATLVVAPLAGVVVDPATVLRPWDPARYGKVIAIRSTETSSPGYTVLLAHLSRLSVPVGASVRRGQVVGRTGRSGNALESLPHLHIEIRAPFPIRYGYGGLIRWLDAFDVLPSLKAAAAAG